MEVSDAAPAMTTASGLFQVGTGCLAGSYDGVFISTDLEPDDALALAALAPKLRGVPLLVVVGEGPVDKREMMANLLSSFGMDAGAVVLQGRTSKASFPSGVAESYHNASKAHGCTILDDVDAAAVKTQITSFLTEHATPFALLLKPPHELVGIDAPLLAKTKATLYGSFNLSCVRDVINEDAGGTLDAAAQHEQQFAFMAKFGRLLWIERSLSVGRDSVLEPRCCPAAIWAAIDAHPGLTRHIQLWNASIVREMGGKIAKYPSDIDKALGPAPAAGSPPVTLTDDSYGKLEGDTEKLDKRVKILLSITQCRGRQVCHADTLVATCLLDDPRLAAYERPCKLAVDTKFKPTMEALPGSNVYGLIAEAGEPRAALNASSLEVLATAFSALGLAGGTTA